MQISALHAAVRTFAPSRAAASPSGPEDSVRLSALSQTEERASEPLQPAARSGLGALGPVLEGELSRLNVGFAEKKRFALWGSPTRALSPGEAAERLEKGKASRLLVEVDGKQLSLRDKTELAALAHLRGHSEREALGEAGFRLEQVGAYEGYLQARSGDELLVMHGDLPG